MARFWVTAWLITMISMSAFGADGSPTLIGGRVVDNADWPAAIWITSPEGGCSATAVGDRTLFTAAHCSANGGIVNFSIGATRYTAQCTHNAAYWYNKTADWALCNTDKSMPGPYEVFASESDAQAACSVGRTYLWTGYGCTRWGGGVDGLYRVGEARVLRCPSGTDYDIITQDTVSACPGDSGSAGYSVNGDDRRIVALMSRAIQTGGTTLASNTINATTRQWIASWANARSTKVCGIHDDAIGCRGVDELPLDDDPWCEAELKLFDDSYQKLRLCLDR